MKSLFTIIFLLAAVGLIVWTAFPLWTEIQKLRVESAEISQTLAKLKDLQTLRDGLLETYKTIPQSKLAMLEELLPQKPDSGRLLVALENITKERGIRLRRIEFGKADNAQAALQGQILKKEAERYNSLPYGFTVSATYESFRSLLSALEKNLRAVDVTDISFTGGQSSLFEFTLKAKSYYQK